MGSWKFGTLLVFGVISTLASCDRMTDSSFGSSMGALQAEAAQTFSISPGSQDASGVFITPLDNPVFTGAIPIESLEQGARTNADAWGFTRFELHMQTTCSAADPFCIAADSRSDDGVLNVWPQQVGTFTEGQVMPFEVHGLGIGAGADAAVVRLDKFTRDGTLSTLGSASVRLADGTIIVPVNVVVVEPAASVSADLHSFMQEVWEDPSYYQALFDDLWTPALQRFSEPGGLLNAIEGQWTARTRQSSIDGTTFTFPIPDKGQGFLRPDDIFAQCGIQFRLASVVVISETSARNVFFTTNGSDALCPGGSDLTLTGIFGSWNTAAMSPTARVLSGAFNQSAVTVEFSPLVNAQDCLTNAKGLSSTTRRISAISVIDQGPSGNRFVLAHEIGHAIGMIGDISPSSAACPNLMCEGGFNSHIPACEVRNGAALAAVPFNCAPVPNETVTALASCDLARAGASAIAGAARVPAPMEPPASGGPGPQPQSWHSSSGQLSFNTSLFTEGIASLSADGSGYRVLTSPTFRTADWFQVGTKLSFDVYILPGQPNPQWVGGLDLFASIPAAAINNASLGHLELTGLSQGAWHTVEFDVSESVHQAMLGDFPGGSLAIAVNTPGGAPSVLLDNLRFSGQLTVRTLFHQGSVSGGTTNPLFSFDSLPDWSSPSARLRSVSTDVTQGHGSLGVDAAGYAEIVSRSFDTAELTGMTSSLSIDVFVSTEQPNPYWIGTVQLFATCPLAGIFNNYLGQVELTGLFQGEFNTVTFPTLPVNLVGAFSTPGNSCSLRVALNVNAGSGEYLLDNLAFR